MIPRIMLEYPRIRGPAQVLRWGLIHLNAGKGKRRSFVRPDSAGNGAGLSSVGERLKIYQELLLITLANGSAFVYIYLNGAGERRPPSPTPPQPAHKEFTMEDKVLNAMKEAGKPVRPGDIAKALGVDSKEVSKACAELKKAGKIHSPKRCYYEPVAE